MKQFMDKDFLLSTETAKKLYFDYAAKMPILDYHCHINPMEIAQDRKFDNITQVWLGGCLLYTSSPINQFYHSFLYESLYKKRDCFSNSPVCLSSEIISELFLMHLRQPEFLPLSLLQD